MFKIGEIEPMVGSTLTKWNACECSLELGDEKLVYHFETAWSPPCPVILKASEMFPELEFRLEYFEGGAGFKGVFEAKGGKILVDKMSNYRGNRGG